MRPGGFLRTRTIRPYIIEALKTWRKKNAAMILATQSSDDLYALRDAERRRGELRHQDVSRQSRHGPRRLPGDFPSERDRGRS